MRGQLHTDRDPGWVLGAAQMTLRRADPPTGAIPHRSMPQSADPTRRGATTDDDEGRLNAQP
jgi:hypothetical protein